MPDACVGAMLEELAEHRLGAAVIQIIDQMEDLNRLAIGVLAQPCLLSA